MTAYLAVTTCIWALFCAGGLRQMRDAGDSRAPFDYRLTRGITLICAALFNWGSWLLALRLFQ